MRVFWLSRLVPSAVKKNRSDALDRLDQFGRSAKREKREKKNAAFVSSKNGVLAQEKRADLKKLRIKLKIKKVSDADAFFDIFFY